MVIQYFREPLRDPTISHKYKLECLILAEIVQKERGKYHFPLLDPNSLLNYARGSAFFFPIKGIQETKRPHSLFSQTTRSWLALATEL